MLSLVIFDAGNLITRPVVVQRWALITFVLIVNTLCWVVSSQSHRTKQSRHVLPVIMLSLSLFLLAGMSTYWERGMASTSTIFYIVPLIVIATLRNRHALIFTSVLGAATYALAAVTYFNTHFNEGYRIQLWGHVVLYCGVIVTCSWLIMTLTGLRHDSK